MESLTGNILGQKHAMDVLFFALEHGEFKLTDLSDDWTTTSKRLTSLEESGLLEVRRRNAGRDVKLYALTPLGEQVVGHLRNIEDLLKEANAE